MSFLNVDKANSSSLSMSFKSNVIPVLISILSGHGFARSPQSAIKCFSCLSILVEKVEPTGRLQLTHFFFNF